jgi:hypothetical protein
MPQTGRAPAHRRVAFPERITGAAQLRAVLKTLADRARAKG